MFLLFDLFWRCEWPYLFIVCQSLFSISNHLTSPCVITGTPRHQRALTHSTKASKDSLTTRSSGRESSKRRWINNSCHYNSAFSLLFFFCPLFFPTDFCKIYVYICDETFPLWRHFLCVIVVFSCSIISLSFVSLTVMHIFLQMYHSYLISCITD